MSNEVKRPRPRPITTEKKGLMRDRVRSALWTILIAGGFVNGYYLLEKDNNKAIKEPIATKGPSVTGNTENREKQVVNSDAVIDPDLASIVRIINDKNGINLDSLFGNEGVQRQEFREFYNNWLLSEKENLDKVWGFFIDKKNAGQLPESAIEKLNKVISFALETKANSSRQSLLSKERLAANLMPDNETETLNEVTNFLKGRQAEQDCKRGFNLTFQVISRNRLNEPIQEALENLIGAMQITISHTLDKKNSTQEEKEQAKAIAKVFLKLIEKLFTKK